MAVFAGSLFAALDHPSKAPSSLSRMANRLPMLLEHSLGDGVAYFIRRAAITKSKSGNRTIAAAAVSHTPSGSYADVDTTGSTRPVDAKSYPENTSRSEVLWLFEQPSNPSLFALAPDDKGAKVDGFLISGRNTSEQPLTEVQGVLKPDSGEGNLELNLSLSGNPTDESVRTIPPGAQFSLVYVFSKQKALSANGFVEKFGGAVFTFHYTHAGTQKALICYFPASRFRRDLQNVKAAPSPALETAPTPR